jgi:glutathione-independent formaldehyde dehydrogenase
LHATRLACMQPGDLVVVYGAGPVGLLAAYSAVLQGASQVMIVDRHPDRLALAEHIGAIAIDDRGGDHVERILELTDGKGADRGCECVGYQCHDPDGHEHTNMTMNDLVKSVKATGSIGCVGVFLPEDPGGPDELAKQGEIAFDFGAFWEKGQLVGTGQCNVKSYNRQLMRLIHNDKAQPSFLVSHELKLDEAPRAYAEFDKRSEGWTKVILHPT